ncbi:MAG: hypothetical protein ABSH50_02055 [Bryobacteraceae bacterium]|jgi:hypothetical protein
MSSQEQIYEILGLTQEELDSELDRIWPRLRTDAGLLGKLSEAHIDPVTLPKRRSDAVTVRPQAAGVVGVDDFLIAVAAGLTVELVKILMEEVCKGRAPESIRKKDSTRTEP